MKLLYLLFVWTLLVLQLDACTYNGDCPGAPFTVCKGGANMCSSLFDGLAVDNNYVYYTQKCRDDSGNWNTTTKRVSVNGGATEVIYSLSPGYYDQINPLNLYEVEGDYLYVMHSYYRMGYFLSARLLSSPSTLIKIIDKRFEGQYYNEFISSVSSLEINNNNIEKKSFLCRGYYDSNLEASRYIVERFDGILGQDDENVLKSLYTFNNPCTAVRAEVGSDNLYVVTAPTHFLPNSVSTFYKMSQTCLNCTTDPQILFTISGEAVKGLVLANNKFYFISDSGLYSSDISGTNKVAHWSGKATGIAHKNNIIFWNSNSSILSMNLDGSRQKQINIDYGMCQCAHGFSGPNCNTCSGQVQWTDGIPVCAAILDNGFPATCYEDYHCGNPPFSYCGRFNSVSGSCSCRYGLGNEPFCDTCSNSSQTIVWDYGYPSCK